jgi:hypothetical protein
MTLDAPKFSEIEWNPNEARLVLTMPKLHEKSSLTTRTIPVDYCPILRAMRPSESCQIPPRPIQDEPKYAALLTTPHAQRPRPTERLLNVGKTVRPTKPLVVRNQSLPRMSPIDTCNRERGPLLDVSGSLRRCWSLHARNQERIRQILTGSSNVVTANYLNLENPTQTTRHPTGKKTGEIKTNPCS